MYNLFRPKITNIITNTHEGVDIYRTTNQQFIVKDLMEIFKDIVQKNPSALNAPVSHIDFGSEIYSTNVEVNEEGVVIRYRMTDTLTPVGLPIRLFRGN